MNNGIIIISCLIFALFLYMMFFNEKGLLAETKKNYTFNFKQNIGIFLLCIIVSTGSVFLYDRFFAIKIVKLDMTAYIKEIQSDYISNKITEAQMDERLLKIRKAIENQRPNKILILSETVVSKNVETIKIK